MSLRSWAKARPAQCQCLRVSGLWVHYSGLRLQEFLFRVQVQGLGSSYRILDAEAPIVSCWSMAGWQAKASSGSQSHELYMVTGSVSIP